MNPDRRRNRHRTPSHGVRFLFLHAQQNGQIRPEPPKGTLRLMQEHRLRGIRHRVQPGLPQNGPGIPGTVQIQEGADLPGILQRMRTVADDLQAVRGKG